MALLGTLQASPVSLNDHVNLVHHADGFREDKHNLLVVRDVLLGKLAALSVLEPLLTHLVTPNVEAPDRLRHSANPTVPAAAGWPFLVASASSQTVLFDQLTH